MAAKQNPATATEKILALYVLLLFSGRSFTLTQLAKHFDCSKQTILRLTRSIDLVGDYLETEVHAGERWYKIKTPSQRPKQGLSEEDVRQLVMRRDIMLKLIPSHMRERLAVTVGAATTLLSDHSKREGALAQVYQHELKGRIDYDAHADILEKMETGIRERCLCHVEYLAVGRDEPKSHVFAPIAIICFKDSYYIDGIKTTDKPPWSEVGPMLLATPRIQDVTLLRVTHAFNSRRKDDGAFGFMKGQSLRCRLRVTGMAAPYVRERIWSEDQVIEQCDDKSIILQFTASSPAEVVSWVLSFGDHAELLAPEDLREELKRQIRGMGERYEKAENP